MTKLPQRLGLTRYEADEYFQQALDAYKKGRYDTAISAINDALALLPGRAEYVATRGLIYLEDGVKDKALADFEQALRLYPFEMLAHYGRGVIAYRDRNWDEALAHFTDAYRADPNRPETLYYLALVYHRKGNNEGAKKLMEAAIERFPADDARRRGDAQKWVKEFEKILNARGH